MVSIITPCFNLSGYISRTYESLVAQTYTEWEWIIVDDESTDNTRDIIRGFEDPRLRLIESAHYGNLSILRNIGARESKGNILFFVDGDDLLVKDKIDAQVNLFNRYPDVGWSHTNALTLIDQTNELFPRGMRVPPDRVVLQGDDAFESLAMGNYLYISSVAVRRDVFFSVGGFSEQFNRCEDIDLWLRLSANGHALGYIKEPKLHYRVRRSSLYSTKQIEYLKTNFLVFDRIRKLYPELSSRYHERIEQHYSNVHFKMGIATLREGNAGTVSMFLQSLKLKFSIKRFAWLIVASLFPRLARKYILKRQSI